MTEDVAELLAPLADFLPASLRPWAGLGLLALAAAIVSGKVFKALPWVWRHLKNLRPRGDKRRAEQRGRFASSVANQISIISQQEEWRDERFTELEAEVEVHGRTRRSLLGRRRRETVRRMPSLSAALEKNREQIILLEGPPGSGKSVALRHLAIHLANRLKQKPSESGVIPVYVNLKEFRPIGPVDAEAVLTFVKASLNRANDRYVERFVEDEFDRGIAEGTWLFLFDSFDEIPSILGATEADEIIEQYATAIYSFLTGLHECRGIIASREFRGPKRITWPRFEILNLNQKQRLDLISKLDLPREVESRIVVELFEAEDAIRQLADSPLFLALLCEHQRDSDTLPNGSHMVFENYVAKRFQDDDGRLQRRFGVSSQTVRKVAEQVAFCMAATPGLGLSPSRVALMEAMTAAGFDLHDETDVSLDALEYLRLARPVDSVRGDHKEFTFAHRRFQEYFCTCLVLNDPSRADSHKLLTDGRWRETTVTLLQTRDANTIRSLLQTASQLLGSMTANLRGPGEDNSTGPLAFQWPAGSLHLLSVFQAAFSPGDPRMPTDLRQASGLIVKAAFDQGQLHDRRWAVEVCTAADADTTVHVLRSAFSSDSPWLQEAAYANVGRLATVPPDLRIQIRRLLAGLAAGGQLRRESRAVSARLSRLARPEPEILLKRFLIATPIIDASLCTLLAAGGLWSAGIEARFTLGSLILIACMHSAIYILRDTRRLHWETRFSGHAAWFHSSLSGLFGPASARLTFVITSFARLYLGGMLALLYFFSGAMVLSLCSVYVALWGLSAVSADRIFNKPTVLKLCALPFVYPFVLIRQFVSIFMRLSLKQLLIALSVLAGLAAAIAGIAWLTYWLTEFFVKDNVIWFSVVSASLALVTQIILISRNIRRRLADHRLMLAYEKGDIAVDDFASLLEILGKFGTDRGLMLFLEELKRRRPAVKNPDMTSALSGATNAIDRLTRRGIPLEPTRKKEKVQGEIDLWLGSLPMHARKVLRNSAPTVIDEFGKMLADADAHRR